VTFEIFQLEGQKEKRVKKAYGNYSRTVGIPGEEKETEKYI